MCKLKYIGKEYNVNRVNCCDSRILRKIALLCNSCIDHDQYNFIQVNEKENILSLFYAKKRISRYN